MDKCIFAFLIVLGISAVADTSKQCKALLSDNDGPDNKPFIQAIKDAGIQSGDSVQAKINLLLYLLNHRQYLAESAVDPHLELIPKYKTMSFSKAKRLVDCYEQMSKGDDSPYQPYSLDSWRNPTQMLKQKIGGECGTQARVFAALLEHLQVPKEDIRIVDAVCDEEYAQLCPDGKGKVHAPVGKNDLSGHSFVLLKIDGKWKIINTVLDPFPRSTQSRFPKVQNYNASSNSELRDILIHLGSDETEMKDFKSPEKLEEELKAGQSPAVPVFTSLPESFKDPEGRIIHFREMSVINVVRPEDYPRHTWRQRANFISSGIANETENGINNRCRFNPKTTAPQLPTSNNQMAR